MQCPIRLRQSSPRPNCPKERHGNVTLRQKATTGATLSASGWKRATHHWRRGPTKSPVEAVEIADRFPCPSVNHFCPRFEIGCRFSHNPILGLGIRAEIADVFRNGACVQFLGSRNCPGNSLCSSPYIIATSNKHASRHRRARWRSPLQTEMPMLTAEGFRAKVAESAEYHPEGRPPLEAHYGRKECLMAHKFNIGQLVELARNSLRPAVLGPYEIRHLIPASDRDPEDPMLPDHERRRKTRTGRTRKRAHPLKGRIRLTQCSTFQTKAEFSIQPGAPFVSGVMTAQWSGRSL